MSRRYTTRDIARVRALAASGMSIEGAARQTGINPRTLRAWHRQFGLPFQLAAVYRPPHPALADLAMARLAATLQRVRAP